MTSLTAFFLASALLWMGLGAFAARMALAQRGMERRLRRLERDSLERQGPGADCHE